MKLIRPPFKGSFAYEIQIMGLVFQWRHDGKPWTPDKYRITGRGLTIGRLHIWHDSMWKL